MATENIGRLLGVLTTLNSDEYGIPEPLTIRFAPTSGDTMRWQVERCEGERLGNGATLLEALLDAFERTVRRVFRVADDDLGIRMAPAS